MSLTAFLPLIQLALSAMPECDVEASLAAAKRFVAARYTFASSYRAKELYGPLRWKELESMDAGYAGPEYGDGKKVVGARRFFYSFWAPPMVEDPNLKDPSKPPVIMVDGGISVWVDAERCEVATHVAH